MLLRGVHAQFANSTPELLDRVRLIDGVEEVDEQVDRAANRLHEDQLANEDLHAARAEPGARMRMSQAEAMDMETAFMKLTEGKTA